MSGDAGSFAVEGQNIAQGQCADMPGSAVAAQELDFHGVGREELNNSADVASANLRIARARKHGYQVQQFRSSRFGHVINRSQGWSSFTGYSR